MLALFARKNFIAAAVGAMVFGLAASSQAVITFSNVTIAGTPSLIAGATWSIGAQDIDFSLPNAVVGDFQPVRQGTITITYEATGSTSADAMNGMVLNVLGGLFGSGQMMFSEVIEDMNIPGVIGTHGPVSITSNSQLPYSANIAFSRPSLHIKVKKEFFLIAEPDTQGLDLARLSLIEQNLTVVPEPASMAALGLGIAAIVARRRKK